MELFTAPQADELSALLEQINVRSVVYCLSDLGAPWGLRVDGSAAAKFHLVLDGRATLSLDDPGVAPAELAAGELALLPHGSGHLIQDERDSPARPSRTRWNLAAADPSTRRPHGAPRSDRQYTTLRTLICSSSALSSSACGAVNSSIGAPS